MRGDLEDLHPPVDPGAWRPIRLVALVGGLTVLALGVVLGRVTAPDQLGDVAAALAPDDLVAQDDRAAAPAVEVAGAVELRSEVRVPASVDQLVIVRISATTCSERATGSGVLIAADTILTAAHVVGDAGLVRIDYGAQVLTGEVAGVFVDDRDLAIITLPAPLDDTVVAGTAPRIGEPITIAGHPEGGPLSVVVGPAVEAPELASRLFAGPLVGVETSTDFGMSGGPAVDADGALVGVLVGSQPGTATAVIAAIDDVAALTDAPLTDGECPESA